MHRQVPPALCTVLIAIAYLHTHRVFLSPGRNQKSQITEKASRSQKDCSLLYGSGSLDP